MGNPTGSIMVIKNGVQRAIYTNTGCHSVVRYLNSRLAYEFDYVKVIMPNMELTGIHEKNIRKFITRMEKVIGNDSIKIIINDDQFEYFNEQVHPMNLDNIGSTMVMTYRRILRNQKFEGYNIVANLFSKDDLMELLLTKRMRTTKARIKKLFLKIEEITGKRINNMEKNITEMFNAIKSSSCYGGCDHATYLPEEIREELTLNHQNNQDYNYKKNVAIKMRLKDMPKRSANMLYLYEQVRMVVKYPELLEEALLLDDKYEHIDIWNAIQILAEKDHQKHNMNNYYDSFTYGKEIKFIPFKLLQKASIKTGITDYKVASLKGYTFDELIKGDKNLEDYDVNSGLMYNIAICTDQRRTILKEDTAYKINRQTEDYVWIFPYNYDYTIRRYKKTRFKLI